MKLRFFSLFLIPTLSPSSEQSTSLFSREAPYVLLLPSSKVQVEWGWNGSCSFEKRSRMEFNEALPIISSPHTTIAPQMRWFPLAFSSALTNCFYFQIELSLCTPCYVQLNCFYGANAPMEFHETLGFFSFPHSHSVPIIWAIYLPVISRSPSCVALAVL